VATLVVERGALQGAFELRNRVVDHPLRDPDGPLGHLEVVEAACRRCHFRADGLDLEGDPRRSAWPGSAKGATKDRVLLLERALLSVPSIEVRTAMLSSQTDVLVE
jgi:hypothetical protein